MNQDHHAIEMDSKYRLFGTDGIRGEANVFPITPDNIIKLGVVIGSLVRSINGEHTSRVLIGRDTRKSGHMIESALRSGLVSTGCEVFTAGIIPTPAVSFLTKQIRCDFGIMISASHNPYHDNGIKLFDSRGVKINEEMETEIERLMQRNSFTDLYCSSKEIGTVTRVKDSCGRYIEYIKSAFPRNQSLSNIKIVVDAANGAAYEFAANIFWELGAEVIRMGDQPNGVNINDNCGSMYPYELARKVTASDAHFGVALDGDADRIVIVDEKGQVVNGDHLIGVIAANMHQNNKLSSSAIVVTNMSNGGLQKYLSKIGIDVVQVQVGDKYVSRKMNEKKINFGGENSGHIIFSDYSNAGDGLLTALLASSILKSTGVPASEAFNVFDLMPQMSKSIEIKEKLTRHQLESISNYQEEINRMILAENGRVIIRESGTEKKVRIMAEGENQGLTNSYIKKSSNYVKELLNSYK